MKTLLFLIFTVLSFNTYSQTSDTVKVYDHYCLSMNPYEIDTTYFWYSRDTLFIRNVNNSFCGPSELKASVLEENDTIKIIVFNPSEFDCTASCSFGYTIKLKTGVFDSLNIKIFDELFVVRYSDIDTRLEKLFVNESIVYPNPVSENLTISLSQIEEIIVTDLSGKTILQQFENSNQINVSQLKKGIYVIKVKSAGETFTEKIIKK